MTFHTSPSNDISSGLAPSMILLVDDEADIRALVRKILRREG